MHTDTLLRKQYDVTGAEPLLGHYAALEVDREGLYALLYVAREPVLVGIAMEAVEASGSYLSMVSPREALDIMVDGSLEDVANGAVHAGFGLDTHQLLVARMRHNTDGEYLLLGMCSKHYADTIDLQGFRDACGQDGVHVLEASDYAGAAKLLITWLAETVKA